LSRANPANSGWISCSHCVVPVCHLESIVANKHYVWDLPLRVFHWGLLVCITGSFVTASLGGNLFVWHFRFGYSRFQSFPPSPSSALQYLKGKTAPTLGHNPLGAFSVYALLLSLLVQVTTGLFANDGIMWDGPLRNWVTGETSDMITGWHKLNRIVLMVLIATHVCAIAFYTWVKKESLVKAMLTGYKSDVAEKTGKAEKADKPSK
jgi:cytochrome b